MKLIRYQYRDGDNIEITNNNCGEHCRCLPNDEKLLKRNVKRNTEYTIKKVHYFGGGCPSVLLEIEELPETHSFDKALPAIWFIPYTNIKK